jgi:hypothetical protein
MEKKKKAPKAEVSDSLRTKVINAYMSSKNNTVRELSERFDLPITAVNSILNNYLKSFSK